MQKVVGSIPTIPNMVKKGNNVMYYGRRNGIFTPSTRKAYKKARWQKSYTREEKRVKDLFLARAFGF